MLPLFLWLLVVPAQLVAGWFVADLLAALFHVVVDKLGGTRAERLPLLGKMVSDFRLHHELPDAAEYLGDAIGPATFAIVLAGAVVMALLVLLGAGVVFAVTVGAGVWFSQAAHRWAHAPTVPRGVRWLQARGLLLSPRNHAGHHVSFDRDFGSLNGWSHPLVNSLLSLLGL